MSSARRPKLARPSAIRSGMAARPASRLSRIDCRSSRSSRRERRGRLARARRRSCSRRTLALAEARALRVAAARAVHAIGDVFRVAHFTTVGRSCRPSDHRSALVARSCCRCRVDLPRGGTPSKRASRTAPSSIPRRIALCEPRFRNLLRQAWRADLWSRAADKQQRHQRTGTRRATQTWHRSVGDSQEFLVCRLIQNSPLRADLQRNL